MSWGPIRLTGVYFLRWSVKQTSEPRERVFAVNLLSDREGDLRPAEQIMTGEDVHVAGRGGSEYTSLWPWAIGLCLVVIMLEWWVYHKKAYI